MAIIRNRYLFSWKDFHDDSQTLGDLERFKLVIENLPDQELMETLERNRGKGRDDHPVRAIWNSLLAGIVYEHASIESLRRELKRNAQLRELCGFNPVKGVKAVPSKSAYNRLMTKLQQQEPCVRAMFNQLIEQIKTLFPDFGTNLAGDAKAVHSYGKPSQKREKDRRREEDADWGVKRYYGIDKNGKAWEKVKSWFGFRFHLIVEAETELPVAYTVTQASFHEQPVMRQLLGQLHQDHPDIVARCENVMLDKGYDSQEIYEQLWDKYHIKPIIAMRNMGKDGETTRQLACKKIYNVTYDYQGTVLCHCPKTGEVKRMA